MLSSKFIKFMKALNSGKVENLSCVVNLGRVGLRMAEEYSTRFDLLEIEQCLFLSQFQTPALEKSEKHLLQLIKKHDPIFSLMEYYDNYPYSYSDINYFFKGCLKSGVEISIKAVNPVTKNNYFKTLLKLEKSLKLYKFFMPWLDKKYKINEILKDLEKHSLEKFNLINEIRFTKNMEECLLQYKKFSFLKRVRFPKIYSYLSSNNMVVSEFIYGDYFYDLLRYKQLQYKDVLDLIRIQLFFMLKVGVFYNNLHSGNLIMNDEKKIYFLDCNTISILIPELRTNIFAILEAIIEKDFERLAHCFNNMSLEKLSKETINKLTIDLKHSFSNDLAQSNGYIIKFMKLFKIASNHGIIFDNAIFSIFKSFIYFNKLIEKTKGKNTDFENDFKIILMELKEIIKKKK
ncbi:AarF/UbiB family protein [Fusobacterium sp.]|uniref:AarF/UbiB family protein n=1 Tax=Fusobacterium sp. TaxID=68766 RepID=UPI0025BD9B07|nr:AarF/UbiB family protein [Fusobacterium sp.]